MRRVPCGVTHLRKSRPCAGAFSFTIVILELRDGIQRLTKKKNLLIILRRSYFCVRSTPLRRLGGGFCGTYIPVPGVQQSAPIHLAELREWIRTLVLFSKFIIHTHPKARHSRFLHIERYSFNLRLSIEKSNFYKKFQKIAIFITLKNVLKNFSNKKFHFDQKTSIYHLFVAFFSKQKKTPNQKV